MAGEWIHIPTISKYYLFLIDSIVYKKKWFFMEVFEKITALGEKKIGSKANKSARNYIRDYIKKNFPKASIYEEKFIVTSTTNNKATLFANGKKINSHLYDNTGAEGNNADGELYIAGKFLSKRERKKARGKIVVFFLNNYVHRIIQVNQAKKSDAAGVLLVSKPENYIQRGIGFPYIYGKCEIPVVGISMGDFTYLKSNAIQNIKINYTTTYTQSEGANLIVDFPGKNKNDKDVLLLGAHYDSWYSGCQDNCIAVQLLIDILEEFYIHKKKTPGRTLRAIFFDGEETGLFGSTHHVNNNDLSIYKLFLNLEMPIPTREGKIKSLSYSDHRHVKKCIPNLSLLRKGIITIPFKYFYRIFPMFPSDIEYFNQKGVPGISTFCNNPNVHTPLDNKENIDFSKYDMIRNLLVDIIYNIDRFE